MTLADRSLVAPELVDDPYGYFRELRENDPVHWSEHHRAWLLTRYDDVRAAFRDPRLSAERVSSMLPRGALSTEEPGTDAIRRLLGNWMVFRDPPAHGRLRRLARAAFTTRRIEQLRTAVREVATGLIDAVADEAEFDLVRDFAFPLPATVIARLLGVPEADQDRFRRWSEDLEPIVFGGLDPGARRERAVPSLFALEAYFNGLLERRRREPGDDLLTALAAAEEAGDALSNDEVVATCILLLFAGHETTTNLIASGFLALHGDSAAWQRLRDDAAIAPSAVEELLRYDGPSKIQPRVALEGHDLRGREIGAGDRVFLVQAAANRDPERFPDPDRLRLDRPDNEHLAFGHGIHHCLGAPLARLEAEVAFSTLSEYLPYLEVVGGGPRWRASVLGRGLVSLPVRSRS